MNSVIRKLNDAVQSHKRSLKDAGDKETQEAIDFLDDLLSVMEKHRADIYCLGNSYNISLNNSCLVGVDMNNLDRYCFEELRQNLKEGKEVPKLR